MFNINEFVKTYDAYIVTWHYTGSAYICEPPVQDTDTDYLILCKPDARLKLVEELISKGYLLNSYQSEGQFVNMKLTEQRIDLILIEDENYYNSFVYATEVAKFLNVEQKDARVSLFGLIRSLWMSNPQLQITH